MTKDICALWFMVHCLPRQEKGGKLLPSAPQLKPKEERLLEKAGKLDNTRQWRSLTKKLAGAESKIFSPAGAKSKFLKNFTLRIEQCTLLTKMPAGAAALPCLQEAAPLTPGGCKCQSKTFSFGSLTYTSQMNLLISKGMCQMLTTF